MSKPEVPVCHPIRAREIRDLFKQWDIDGTIDILVSRGKGRPGRSIKWIGPKIAEDRAFDRRIEQQMERHYEDLENGVENSY